jgi:hypothetical protein
VSTPNRIVDDKAAWVYLVASQFGARTPYLRCDRCLTNQEMPMPMEFNVLADRLMKFARTHRRCKGEGGPQDIDREGKSDTAGLIR